MSATTVVAVLVLVDVVDVLVVVVLVVVLVDVLVDVLLVVLGVGLVAEVGGGNVEIGAVESAGAVEDGPVADGTSERHAAARVVIDSSTSSGIPVDLCSTRSVWQPPRR